MTFYRIRSDPQSELGDFEIVSTAAGEHATPETVEFGHALRMRAPCTVASTMAAAHTLDQAHPPDLDGRDHWFRTRIPSAVIEGPRVLMCEGLATLAEVWLDGQLAARSENMFLPLELALPDDAGAEITLVLCFRALLPVLAARRPRPRWRTRLVDRQQLRFVRTSLLGRTPGFCPSVPIVGPYRPVRVEHRQALHVERLSLQTHVTPHDATVSIDAQLKPHGGASPGEATLTLEGAAGSGEAALTITSIEGALHVRGSLAVRDLALWWPHTHGSQPLSRAWLTLSGGVVMELGELGFRSLQVDRSADELGFGLCINGAPLFCRGACWTTDDLVGQSASGLARTLTLAKRAGMNMLRVTGTTAYECDEFYALCDRLGILVFQDFMFANMDYPIGDESFAASVHAEATSVLSRIGHRACLAVLCGGSEVEQQIDMLGLPKELSASALFDELLPDVAGELAPGVPYIRSTPTGGALSFRPDQGVCHYYGVGAYLRPLDDARRSNVRFAAECLAFANVPCRETIEQFMGDLETPSHHPRWKERVPRDRGVGWDFEDVRDHYVRRLFDVDPAALRYGDPERYLVLGSAAVSELMTAVYSEWRRARSSCRGALVYWLKDLWPGAGWGVIDALGRPKSAYYALARVFAPTAVLISDEGLNGLHLHVLHERGPVRTFDLRVVLYRDGEVPIAQHEQTLELAPGANQELSVDTLIGRFCDPGYAYRFGPPAHDLVVATLHDSGVIVSQAFHFPGGPGRARERDLGLTARVAMRGDELGVQVGTRRFAQHVTLDVPGFLPLDDAFHLEPGSSRFVALEKLDGAKTEPRGTLGALNCSTQVAIARS